MRRVSRCPRTDWIECLQRLGVPEPRYSTERGGSEQEWSEDAVYVFSSGEIERLQQAAAQMRALVLQAVEAAMSDPDALARMAIPPHTQALLRWSWDQGQRNLVSRYDWCFDGTGAPKLLEINGETCYGMLLASRGQAKFQQAEYPGAGQWNELEAALTQAFRHYGGLNKGVVHFACDVEDTARRYEAGFAQACASAAGLKTCFVAQDDIAFDPEARRFVDEDDRPITALYLYQMWEQTIDSPMAEFFFEPERVATVMLEPSWRLLVSNKAFLAWMWERFEGHELLLPTFVDTDPRADTLGDTYAEKPIYGFEGANVRLFSDGQVVAENPDPEFGCDDGMVYQALRPLPSFDGRHPLVSTWEVAAGAPALSIREGGLITDYYSPMVPHIVADGPVLAED